MAAIAIVDAHRFIIPDRLSLAAFLLGLAAAAQRDLEDMPASIAMAVISALFWPWFSWLCAKFIGGCAKDRGSVLAT